MVTSSISLAQAVTFALLALAVVAVWLRRHLWALALAAAVITGYFSGVLVGTAAVWLLVYAIAAALFVQASRWGSAVSQAARWLGLAGILLIALALAFHAVPTFHNVELMGAIVLSRGSAPYSQWLNFDKTAAGLILLGMCYPWILRTRKDWARAGQLAAAPAAATIVIVMLLSLALGFVRFAPKYTALFWPWAAVNLLFTCMAEETFFRGFIQTQLAKSLKSIAGARLIALLTSGVLFGLAHFAGGWKYVTLAIVAGLGYALVYERSRSLEMSMLTHFSLNVVHFLLFTYPYQVG